MMDMEWINVWDKAPHDEERVLITHNDKVQIATCCVMNDRELKILFEVPQLDFMSVKSDWWMPLPAPYSDDQL
jgi:hypothetical protein